jgi:hypothetical protein
VVYAKRSHHPEYFDASICPCGNTQKDVKKHQKSETHQAWLLAQQEHDESEDDDAAGPVAGTWWDD